MTVTRPTHLLALALIVPFAIACEDPAQSKPPAEVPKTAAVVTAAAPAPSAAPAGTTRYAFDGQSSKIGFVGAKLTGKHDGSFGTFSGTVELPDGKPERGSVEVEIDLASVTTDSAKLTGHLKTPDFFDVAKHPKAKFRSTTVAAGGQGEATHTVTGDLTLHGVTRSVTFPARIRVAPDAVSIDADVTLDRKTFGIEFPGMPDDLIRNEVPIHLSVRATPVKS